MGKHDHPTLQMQVQAGRLVPLTPYEAEVLSTYSNGAVLTVDMNQKRSLPLLKKYWAVLRDVVSNCKTPWNSPDEASDALKLALGVTDIGKTVSGQWFIRAGSISFTSMDQAAFKDFFDKAMAVLAEVTGIDPDELSSRYRHIPEQETSDAPLSSGEGSDGTPSTQTPPVAAPLSADEADNDEAGEHEAADGQSAAPASSSQIEPPAGEKIRSTQDGLMEAEPVTGQSPVGSASPNFDEPTWLRDFAKLIVASIGPDEAVVVNSSKGMFRDDLSEDARTRAKAIINYARAACRGELELASAREIIAGKAGVEEKELGS